MKDDISGKEKKDIDKKETIFFTEHVSGYDDESAEEQMKDSKEEAPSDIDEAEVDDWERKKLTRAESLKKRKRKVMIFRAAIALAALLLLGTGIWSIAKNLSANNKDKVKPGTQTESDTQTEDSKKETQNKNTDESVSDSMDGETADLDQSEYGDLTLDANANSIIKDAKKLAAGYDYDEAIRQLQTIEGYEESKSCMDAIAEYEKLKDELVLWDDVTTITHVFFHVLIVDTSLAFDGDSREVGYNQVMTTRDEFNKIIQQMYDKGYVLISIKDMVKEVVDDEGNVSLKAGEIWLPEGKTPFVLSVDDLSYHDDMVRDGFASRLVVDENGRPSAEYVQQDGTSLIGDYDVVPCLETFLEEHPDFSYKGARGILAVTGHYGVMGYKVGLQHKDSDNYEEEVAKATHVAEVLKEWGWEFGSHSFAHISYGSASLAEIKEDNEKWVEVAGKIVGEVDMLIYPFGSDIGDWTGYSGEKFDYLSGEGYKYFFNVDSAQYWVQLKDNYVRQGRRNLDGYRMYSDMTDDSIDLLSDLFDVNSVFDEARPTPVPKL